MDSILKSLLKFCTTKNIFKLETSISSLNFVYYFYFSNYRCIVRSGSKHGVEVKCLKVDFSEDEIIYDVIKKFLKNYDIGVLVNNVGTGTMPVKFLDLAKYEPDVRSVMRVNVTSLIKVKLLI